MFKRASPVQINIPRHLAAPIGGFDPSSLLSAMPQQNAPVLDNWFSTPDGLVTRDGYATHITAIPKKVDRLHVYAAPSGGESLWGSTNDGIYNFTGAGACPAASIVLTNGKSFSTAISTGAGNYMLVVNGTDTLKQYDGTTWTSIATLGTVTSLYSYIETYRQRIFFAKRASLEIEYLAANSIGGTATNYPLGALFRKGGYIVALAVWTIDGGVGPEDNLAVLTNKGEIGVFAGNDPATWSLRGVYFAGIPMGDNPTFKYGGDILIITETGIVAMSALVQSAAIDRTTKISDRVRPFLVDSATSSAANQGWQIIGHPSQPALLVNIPSATRQQAVMHSQSLAWSTYTGWNALCFARKGAELYFGGSDGATNTWKVKRVTGFADDGTTITATMLQAYTQMGYAGNKKIEEIKPYFESGTAFTYNGGVSADFQNAREYSTITLSNGLTAAIWGTSLFGAATWGGGSQTFSDWQTVPDEYSNWKGLYLQTMSRLGKVTYIGSDILYKNAGHF